MVITSVFCLLVCLFSNSSLVLFAEQLNEDLVSHVLSVFKGIPRMYTGILYIVPIRKLHF